MSRAAKAAPVAISRDEWLLALGEAETLDPDALTTRELAALTQRSERSMRDRLSRLVTEGRVRRAWKRDADGRRVRAYVLLTAQVSKALRKASPA